MSADERNIEIPAELINQIPVEMQAEIIQTAAAITEKPVDELTIDQAISILSAGNPAIDQMISAAAAEGMTPDQVNAFFASLISGGAGQSIVNMLEMAKQYIQQNPDNTQTVKKQFQDGIEYGLNMSLKQITGTLSERQINKFKATASEITGRPADDLTAEEAFRIAAEQMLPEKMRTIETNKKLPGIDPEQLRKIQETLQAHLANANASIKGTESRINENLTDKIQSLQDAFKSFGQIMTESINALKAAGRSELGQQLKSAMLSMSAKLPLMLEAMSGETDFDKYLEEELQKPEYGGLSIQELLESGMDENGEPIPDSLFIKALNAARAAAANKENIPRAAAKRSQSVEYPLDKPNSIIWNLLETDTEGQIAFNLAKYGSKKEVPAYYAIDFDDLGNDIQITKRLQPFDKRVYIAVSSLFNAGNNIITIPQIYYAMGYTGTPGDTDRTKINDSITKMTAARIFFDNEQEAAVYKYDRFRYDGSLLPLERGTAIVNGQLVDAAVHIFREPPLITFAKQRKQITTIDIKLLQSPISKTDANLSIDDYLLERISKAKNGKGRNCRILFKTLYERAGITTKKQEQRAPNKIKKYLTHYQNNGFITRFTMEKDGITIHW